MKKLLVAICVCFFFSCSENNDNSEDSNLSKTAVERIARKYDCKVEPLIKSENHLMFSDFIQLEEFLKAIKENNREIKIETIGIEKPKTALDTIYILNFIDQTKLNIVNSADNKKDANQEENGGDVYQYSHTFYFNNTFPMPNLAVTVSYNLSSQGLITGSSVTTSTWGNSFGTTWVQTSHTLGFNGIHIWFTINGQYKNQLGFGSWSIISGNPVHVSGGLTLTGIRPGGGQLIGACSQRPIM